MSYVIGDIITARCDSKVISRLGRLPDFYVFEQGDHWIIKHIGQFIGHPIGSTDTMYYLVHMSGQRHMNLYKDELTTYFKPLE